MDLVFELGGEVPTTAPDYDIFKSMSGMLAIYFKVSQPFAGAEKQFKKRLGESAEKLPVYKWIEAIPGAVALGLGKIIGEAGGSLDKYATVSKLWKRFGLAPP